jgi:hypothetical protein
MQHAWLILGTTERLIELHALTGVAALSFREMADAINAEFGTDLTRSACIDRVHELQLERRSSLLSLKRVPGDCPKPHGVSFARNEGCWWPYGELTEKPIRFCGARVQEGSSWCPAHYHKVYVVRP